METVREALCLFEEFDSSCFVEVCSCLGVEWQVNAVEISVSSPFNPLLVGGLLDALLGPIPCTLALDDV